MKIKVLREAGYEEALLGLSLSYEQPIENMPSVASILFDKEYGHNKFLESITVWLDVTAPRYWWQQFDTYRVGMTKQSGSTIHTLLRRSLTQEDFEEPIFQDTLDYLNYLIENKDFTRIKNELPEGFLQRRVVKMNYKNIRHIIRQRITHKLPQWSTFISELHALLEHPEFIEDLIKGGIK